MIDCRTSKDVEPDVARRMREIRDSVREGKFDLPPRLQKLSRASFAGEDSTGEGDIPVSALVGDSPLGEHAGQSSTELELIELGNRVHDLHSRRFLTEFQFPSRVPIVGVLISAIRKTLNNLSARWYIKHALNQQMGFNAVTADVVNRVISLLALHNHRTLSAEASVRDLTGKAASVMDNQNLLSGHLSRVSHNLELAVENLNSQVEAAHYVIDVQKEEIGSLQRLLDEQHLELRTIRAELNECARELPELRTQLRALNEKQHEVRSAYVGLALELTSKIGLPSSSVVDRLELSGRGAPPAGQVEFDYSSFTGEFGAPESLVRSLYEPYVKFFDGCQNVLDVGSGRGTFLSLLRDSGIEGYGVDLNQHLVRICLGRGLRALCEDGVVHLESLPDASLDGVFLGQVIEHLDLGQKLRLLKLCWAKLQPDKYLVLETPNIRSLWVLSDVYFRDPSHTLPVHPETYRYLVEVAGFRSVIEECGFPMSEDAQLKTVDGLAAWELCSVLNDNFRRLNRLLFADHNVAIIGQK